MRFLSIVKTPRHRRFGYEPVFFDPVKEDLDQRVQDIEQRLKAEKEGIDPEGIDYGVRISQSFRYQRGKKSIWQGFTSSTAFVRMLIAFLLVGLSYLFLEYGDSIEKMSFVNATPIVIVVLGFGSLYMIARFQSFRKR
jgi:hypothetical protein